MGDTHTQRGDKQEIRVLTIMKERKPEEYKRNDRIGYPRYHGNQTLIVWSTLPVATTLTNLGAESAGFAVVEPLGFASVVASARRPHANVVTKCP